MRTIRKMIGKPLLSFLILIVLGVFIDAQLDAFIQLVVIYVLINMVLGMSLNLVNGYTGQFSLGHAGFMAVGAYTSAFLSQYLPISSSTWEQLIYIAFCTYLGGLASALAGFFVGLPSLRLKGDYLAIVTLGFGEIIRVVLLNTQAVGGARGFYGIQGFTDFHLESFSFSKFLLSYSHAVFWVIVCFFVIWRLMKSTQGRSFLSVREDEIAAESLGISTTQAKVRSFVLSSFFAGIAGGIFAHYTNYINPASFGFNRSVDAVIMVVLGGMGSMSGSMIAAVFITVVPEALRPLQNHIGVDIRMILYSLSLILLMILRPKGIFGSQEITSILTSKFSFRLFPFRLFSRRKNESL